MGTAELQLQAALEVDDCESLLRLCQQLDSNLTVTAGGFEGQPHIREISVTHHVANKPYGLDCLKVLIDKFGTACLTCRDGFNSTPVIYAAAKQSHESLELIYKTLGSGCFQEKGKLDRNAVHSAASNTSNAGLKWLVGLLGPACLTVKDNRGDTAVHISAWRQDSDSMKFVKAHLGSDCFRERGCAGRTAVHWAAENKISNSAFNWLIGELGSDTLMQKINNGSTVVHFAASVQNADVMQSIKYNLGTDCFRQRGFIGRSAVHYAALNEVNNSALKWLVDELGSNSLMELDDNGDTVVHLAASFQNSDSMKFVKSKLGFDCFRQRGFRGRTAVHCAALNEASESALKWLIGELGSDSPMETDDNGNTFVQLAAHFQSSDSMPLIKSKLGSECFRQRGFQGRTAVHCAAVNTVSNLALKWLIGELGPDSLKQKDDFGLIACHLVAISHGEDSMDLMKELLGVEVLRQPGLFGQTAAHFAAQNTRSPATLAWCVKELGTQCLSLKDTDGDTPIHIAAQHQGGKSMQLAVSSLGLDCLRLEGEKQRTAVHFAAMNSSSNSALRWIVDQLGPECLTLRDADGCMALHLAAEHQGVDSLMLIRDSLGVDAFDLKDLQEQSVTDYAKKNSQAERMLGCIAELRIAGKQ